MDSAWPQRLVSLYPALDALGAGEFAALGKATLTVGAGTMLFDEGAPCRGFPMVLSGSIRVARGSPAGRSLELYRVTPGELCVMSTSCLLGRGLLAAHGLAAETTEFVLVSPADFDRWCDHEAFRRFVFSAFGERLADLMALAEAVAFQRLDQRLAQMLLGHGSAVFATHQSLADALGTVREIVSRLLSRFERSGWVRLARERIDILDAPALRALAAGPAPRGQP
jgi:CRP/FNR family transcriptional regulator